MLLFSYFLFEAISDSSRRRAARNASARSARRAARRTHALHGRCGTCRASHDKPVARGGVSHPSADGLCHDATQHKVTLLAFASRMGSAPSDVRLLDGRRAARFQDMTCRASRMGPIPSGSDPFSPCTKGGAEKGHPTHNINFK